MNPYEQYIRPYMPDDSRARMILLVLGGVAGILFVWWFIQVVIGRNFKLSGSEYKDQGGTNTGGNGAGQNTALYPTLEVIMDNLHAVNQKRFYEQCAADWTGLCKEDPQNARHKAYWDFLGISEGLMGQKSIATRYNQKYGTTLKNDFDKRKSSLQMELVQRVEAVLSNI